MATLVLLTPDRLQQDPHLCPSSLLFYVYFLEYRRRLSTGMNQSSKLRSRPGLVSMSLDGLPTGFPCS